MAYDWQQYLASNPDLGAAGLSSEEDAMWHYNTYGQNEGRVMPSLQSAAPTSYYYGNPSTGGGHLTSDQYNQFMALAPQDAYNLARTQYGMNRDQIADLFNRYNPGSTISSQDLYTQFDPGLRDYLAANNLGYVTYNNGEGVGKAARAGTELFGEGSGYGLITAYDPNPIRMVSAPAGSVVFGPTPTSPDQLYHWSDGSISETATPPNAAGRQTRPPVGQQPPTQQPIPAFGLNYDQPFSGNNWRGTVLSGQSDADIFGKLSSFADAGGSLSAFERENLLSPGFGQAYYDRALQYADQHGLLAPLLPSVTAAQAPYYHYGFGPGQRLLERTPQGGQSVVNPIAAYLDQIYNMRQPTDEAAPVVQAARGGYIGGLGQMSCGKAPRFMRGGGGGQDDDIPARLSANEYVLDAEFVAQLGDGNPEAGARKLDQMRANLRRHKRAAPNDKIPPKAKKPEQYLKGR